MSAKPNGTFCWADLTPADQGRAIGFYRDVFGWSATPSGPEYGGYAPATLDAQRVGAFNPPVPGATPTWLSYFATDDLEATLAKVDAAGGQVIELMQDLTIMNIPAMGRMAVCTEPTGATFGLWQADGMDGFERFGEPGSFCWTEVYSTDSIKTRDFFTAVFGLESVDMPAAPGFIYHQLIVSGAGMPSFGVMQIGEGFKPGTPSSFGAYIQVDNADETVVAAVAAGATAGRAPEDTPFGRLAELTDPEGAEIKLMGSNSAPAA